MGQIKRPAINVTFESRAQLERIKKAAHARKWSINTFLLDAAEKQMNETVPPGQLAATNDPSNANQQL